MLFTLLKLLLQVSIIVLYVIVFGLCFVAGYIVYQYTQNFLLVLLAAVIVYKLGSIIIKLWKAFVYAQD